MSSTKSGTKKSDMFAKLAAQQARSPAPPLVGPPTDGTDTIDRSETATPATAITQHVSAGTQAPAPIPAGQSTPATQPIPPAVIQHSHESASTQGTRSAGTQVPAEPSPSKGKIKGKRENPDYVQANAYIPKKLRRAVERALLDLEDVEQGTDYSTLVEELLRQWLRSRGVSV